MGDGSVNTQSNAKPRFRVDNTNQRFLEWVDNELGCYSTGVRKVKTASEVASSFSKTGFTEDVDESNCQDVYAVHTRTSPKFDEFAEWYESGRKVFPSNISLTPLTLKMWFVCDGYANKRGSSYYVGIQMANELSERDKIGGMFSDGPGVEVSYWNVRDEEGCSYCCAEFDVDSSQKLVSYMGDVVPGFEYKWPNDSV
jgi:hypothetical protein